MSKQNIKQEYQLVRIPAKIENHAEKTLKRCIADIEVTTEFLKTGLINKKGLSFKVESEKVNAMLDLSNSINNDVVKYAFGKRTKATANRELNNYLKSDGTKE